MKRKTLMSWSSGKDSAWALHQLQQDPTIEVTGLFCTITGEFKRATMHAVRVELLKQQAQSIGLPLELIEIPYPCSNDAYGEIMGKFIEKAKQANIQCIAFGDLFLEDVRNYRQEKLAGTDIEPIFPLWNIPTNELAQQMLDGGLKTVITCVDPKQISKDFVGREYCQSFLNDLPQTADPCGEKGEFHSFVFDGPMFNHPIDISLGEVVERDGFIFIDVTQNLPS